MNRIGWERPREPMRFYLLTQMDGGPSPHPTTEDELREAGYVSMTGVEVREALAWRAIDKWLRANKKTAAARIMPLEKTDEWSARPLLWSRTDGSWSEVSGEQFVSSTKTEALEALAKWCEANP